MPTADGPQGPVDHQSEEVPLGPNQTVETQLFESFVHHLIEKGVLTKNDALSVVKTVAEVKRGQLEAEGDQAAVVANELVVLERLYASFELVTTGPDSPLGFDGRKVVQLRPPIHGDSPKFPKDD